MKALAPMRVPAILDGLSPLKDGGMSIRYHTQEMTAEEKTKAMEYYQQFGWLLFAPNEINEQDVPKEKAVAEFAGKTPSQRLRAVLYILWQSSDEPDFEVYYRMKMESIINQVKDKLEG